MGDELTLPLAFMAGLAGAGHCWTMCGGLVGGLFVGRGCAGSGCQPSGLMLPHLGYHAGRVLAYTLLGALAAGVGQAIVLTGEVGLAQAVLYVVAGLGVVLAGMWTLYRAIVGRELCSDAGPARLNFFPLPQPLSRLRERGAHGRGGSAYALAGFLNGLMPCALVFSLTLKAATAPSVATGAAWLFVFGLGTVPAMALAGGLAHWLGAQALVWLRRAAAVLVIGLGLQAIWAGYKFFQVMLHL
jgi:sulfite exporter TauE/SafE